MAVEMDGWDWRVRAGREKEKCARKVEERSVRGEEVWMSSFFSSSGRAGGGEGGVGERGRLVDGIVVVVTKYWYPAGVTFVSMRWGMVVDGLSFGVGVFGKGDAREHKARSQEVLQYL